MRTSMDSRGFTLIELSIVLVLIGMMVVGILGGRSLLERSKVESVVREVQAYKSAFGQFTAKYKQLPGDMVDAYTYFDPTNTDVLCGANTTGATGCNGNGNGIIFDPFWYFEALRAWQHLQLAGFVDGSFSGVALGSNHFAPKINLPGSALSDKAGYLISTFTAAGTIPGVSSAHALLLASSSANGLAFGGAAIKVADAVTVDQKMDDGLASSGWMETINASGMTHCVTANVYVVDESVNGGTDQCMVYFVLQNLY